MLSCRANPASTPVVWQQHKPAAYSILIYAHPLESTPGSPFQAEQHIPEDLLPIHRAARFCLIG